MLALQQTLLGPSYSRATQRATRTVIEGRGEDDYDKHHNAERAAAACEGALAGLLVFGVAGALLLGGACTAINAGALVAVPGFV